MGTLFIYQPKIFLNPNLPDRSWIRKPQLKNLKPKPELPKPGNGNLGCVHFGAGLYGVWTIGPELPKRGSIESESESESE